MSKFGFDPADYRDNATKQVARVIDTAMRESGALDRPLDYALWYAGLGWYVLPVRADKKPVSGYGLTRATNDPRKIEQIWAENPDAGVAVACAQSGLVVLDIDPRNGGYDTLKRLEAEHGPLKSSTVTLTQGGGEHRYFQAEPGVTYPASLGPGVDVKHNGYVLAEPSRGELGFYRWGHDGCNPTKGSLPGRAPSLLRESSTAQGSGSTEQLIRPGSIAEPPSVYAELKVALNAIPPDTPYDEGWFRVMQGMTRLGDERAAYDMTREWSLRSSNPRHTAEEFDRKWRACSQELYAVTHKSIFHMADERDRSWRTHAPALEHKPSDPHPLSLSLAVDSGAGRVSTIEYLFDRFMSTGVNIVAGAPGVGKTTLIVPLALAAAHLCPADYPMRPRVRRNVIIITESVVQVQRVIYSVAQRGCTGMSEADFDARVRVISARRLDPELVSEVAAEYQGWTVDNLKVDGTFHSALPLVVFDTANAVLELESENDNAEVGRAMAHLKQAFSLFPVIIVAHTSKALGRGEAEGLVARGASAWTGDAQGTYMVFKDGEDRDAPRVLKTDKVRFPTAFDEVALELVSHSERHPNILGEMEDEWFTHSVARPLARGERTQLKEDAKELRAQDEWVTLCDELLQLVRDHPEHSRSYYEQLPKAKGGPRGSQERKERAMTSLINDGCLKIVALEKPKGRADHYLRVDEEIVNSIEKGRYEI